MAVLWCLDPWAVLMVETTAGLAGLMLGMAIGLFVQGKSDEG